MLKKILIGVGGLVGLVVVAGVAAPFFIDVNDYKPRIVAAVKDATGRDLAISGPIKLSLLPSPSISAEGVTLSNMAGGKAPRMVEMKAVRASVAFWPLLSKRVDITEIRLVQPTIAIEVGANGRANYDFTGAKPAPGAPAPAAGGSGFAIAAQRAVIEGGTITYADARAGGALRFEKVDLTVSMGSPAGPFGASGSLTANGVPLTLDARLAARDAKGLPLTLSLKTGDGELGLSGVLSDLAPTASYEGKATLQAGDLAGFLKAVATAATGAAPDVPAALSRRVAYEGGLTASAAGIAAKGFKLTLGEDSGGGDLAIKFAPLNVEGKVAFQKLDLDKLLATGSVAKAAPGGRATVPMPSAPASPGVSLSALPTGLGLKLQFEAREIVYNAQAVKDVGADVELTRGQLTVRKLAALLPGGAKLAATSETRTVQGKAVIGGTVDLSGPKLRDLLTWLKIDVASLPADRLGAFGFRGKLEGGEGGALRVGDAEAKLDGMTVRGAVAVTMGARTTIVADIAADQIDVDAYMPKKAPAPARPGQNTAPPAGGGFALPAGIDARIKAKIARVVYGGERIDGLDLDVQLANGQLRFGDTKIAGVAGAAVALKGTIGANAGTPTFDLALGVQASDVERLAKLAGVASPLKGPIGPLTLQGGIAGTPADLTFRDFAITALGAAVRLTGKVSVRNDGPHYDLSAFSLRTDDIGRLTAAADSPSDVGAVSVAGALKGDARTIAYRGDFAVKGLQFAGAVQIALGGAVPKIVADMKTGDLDLDRLAGGKQGPAAPSGGGKLSRDPIDLSALRSLDLQLALGAATLRKGPWRLDGATLNATVQGGVLTVTRLAGGFYGGSLDLSTRIDATKAPARIDGKLAASNVNLASFAGAMVGSNRVAGALTANFTFAGGLASVADLVASLNADGKVGGTVRFVATDAERLAGRALGAGARGVGQALGDALGGTPLSGVARGVDDVGAAIAVASERFAGRAGPMAGDITVRAGQLTTNNLRVDGDRAWAITVAAVNLATWTQDVTLNLFVQEDSTRPYVIVKQSGSAEHPARSIARGGAQLPQERQQPQQPQQTPPGQAPPTQPRPAGPVQGVQDLLKGLGRR